MLATTTKFDAAIAPGFEGLTSAWLSSLDLDSHDEDDTSSYVKLSASQALHSFAIFGSLNYDHNMRRLKRFNR